MSKILAVCFVLTSFAAEGHAGPRWEKVKTFLGIKTAAKKQDRRYFIEFKAQLGDDLDPHLRKMTIIANRTKTGVRSTFNEAVIFVRPGDSLADAKRQFEWKLNGSPAARRREAKVKRMMRHDANRFKQLEQKKAKEAALLK